jgi:hypothetical protein
LCTLDIGKSPHGTAFQHDACSSESKQYVNILHLLSVVLQTFSFYANSPPCRCRHPESVFLSYFDTELQLPFLQVLTLTSSIKRSSSTDKSKGLNRTKNVYVFSDCSRPSPSASNASPSPCCLSPCVWPEPVQDWSRSIKSMSRPKQLNCEESA